MSVRVWKRIALTAALLVWGAASQAQTTKGSAAGVGVSPSPTSGQGAVPQVRPAPVTGRVAPDPTAVALRPAAQQPVTSSARQVPPPANPNEPLLMPESEQVKAAPSARHAQHAPVAGQEAAAPVTTPARQHMDRTRGVKKTNETQPRPHERRVKGKPHHAGQKASSVEPKDERHHGGKRGSLAPGKPGKSGRHVAALSPQHAQPAGGAAPHHVKRAGTHKAVHKAATQAGERQGGAQHPSSVAHGQRAGAPRPHAGQPAHVKHAGTSGKARHAHAAAAKASAPVAKKPVHHKHRSA